MHVSHARQSPTRRGISEFAQPLTLASHFAFRPLLPDIELAVLLDVVSAIGLPTTATLHLRQTTEALFPSVFRIRNHLACSRLSSVAATRSAISPALPLAERTSFWMNGATTHRLVQVAITRITAVGWFLSNRAITVPLLCVTSIWAIAPNTPIRKQAITRFVASRIAALSVQKSSVTWFSAFVVHLVNRTLPFTEADACGFIPITPIRERAIFGHALRVAILNEWTLECLNLASNTFGGIQTLEYILRSVLNRSLASHCPIPHCSHVPTTRVAFSIRPIRPYTVGCLHTLAGTIGNLLSRLLLARRAAMIWQCLDTTVSPALASALRATTPIRPSFP